MPDVRVAVIYYSATGNVHDLAEAVAEGAAKEASDVRLRRVAETAPEHVVTMNPAWVEHRDATAEIPVATPDDIEWADVVLFGTPTRFGNVCAQLKQFLDSLGPLWFQGALADKVYAGFVTTGTGGGAESTLLALYQSIHHFGGIVVSPGYTDPVVFRAGGNPYGVHHNTRNGTIRAGDDVLAAARHLGLRATTVAALLKSSKASAT